MKPRIKGALFLILAFLLGVGAGAFGFGIYEVRGGWGGSGVRGQRFQRYILGRLDRELNLTPAQHEKVESALQETRLEFQRLREEMRPRFREIVGRSRERIKAALDPAQQAKFDAIVAEWERRGDRWRGETKGEVKRP